MPGKRVAIFIDGSNFYKCKESELPGRTFDYAEFRDLLTADRDLVRVYYYNAPLDPSFDKQKYKEQQKFFDYLRHLDYFEVKLGKLVRRGGRYAQKGVDVRLAVDMVGFAASDLYDVAVLVSGDGDFADAVQHVKNLGKHVENAFFNTGRSRDLSGKADRFVLLNDTYLKDCLA